jgi:hypothetical protein
MRMFMLCMLHRWFYWWISSSSHSSTGNFNDDVLLGLGSIFRAEVTSALKMEKVRFSKMLASTNQSTSRLNPEEHHHHHHRSENLKSHISNSVLLHFIYHVYTHPHMCAHAHAYARTRTHTHTQNYSHPNLSRCWDNKLFSCTIRITKKEAHLHFWKVNYQYISMSRLHK